MAEHFTRYIIHNGINGIKNEKKTHYGHETTPQTKVHEMQVDAMQLIGLYRENAIAIESEARYPFGGNVYYVTMQITFPIPEFARKERNLHCDVVHVTTKWVSRLVLDDAIAAIQTSR